jgi:hypothetical protein
MIRTGMALVLLLAVMIRTAEPGLAEGFTIAKIYTVTKIKTDIANLAAAKLQLSISPMPAFTLRLF